MPLGWVAAAGVVGSVASGLIQGNAAKSAANTQAGAAEQAQQIQQQEFNTVLGNEAPFVQQGTNAVNKLSDLMGTSGNTSAQGYGSLNQPFTADTFKSMSPAYQFQLQQGAQGTLNQASSAQGAESGAALKDLQSYNQNFANTSFNNAFQQYQTQQNNVFGRLNSLATLGQGAASNQATGASSFANSIGQSATNVGTALGAGQIGQANAYSGAIQSAIPWLASSQGGGAAAQSGAGVNADMANYNWYCDRRMKEATARLGIADNGLPVYEFNYIGDTVRHIGYMADEVLEKYPEAVSVGPKGYLMVDYGKVPNG